MIELKPQEPSQEKPCWLCQSVNAIRGKCLYHALEPLLGYARSMSVDLESAQQNRREWEERALKAEAELLTRPTPDTGIGQGEALKEAENRIQWMQKTLERALGLLSKEHPAYGPVCAAMFINPRPLTQAEKNYGLTLKVSPSSAPALKQKATAPGQGVCKACGGSRKMNFGADCEACGGSGKETK